MLVHTSSSGLGMSIERHYLETKNGNTLSLFYNPNNDLVVLSLVSENEDGGNDLFRKTLDEEKLLEHLK
jgi:hypothetical protein